MNKLMKKPAYYPSKVWFWKPEARILRPFPFWIGHDEYARKTLVLGYPFTGRVIIAYKDCQSDECSEEREQREKWIQRYHDNNPQVKRCSDNT